jgi:Family of unknown function (DUF5640)
MKTLTLLIAICFSLCIFGCSSAAPTTTGGSAKNDNSSQAKNPAAPTNTSTASTANTSSAASKTDSPLANSLAGTWEMPTDKDSKMTFDKDGTFISSDKNGADKGTYSVIDDETIKIKSDKMPPDTKLKIKVTGDNMEMTMEGMEPMILKRTK